MKNDVLTITCRNENGIDEDRTYCIDYNLVDARITNYMKGSKISYDNNTLKIGRIKIPIVSHNTFGGSWCAEDFHMKRSEVIKLMKYLKKNGWTLEESTVMFERWWEDKI